MSKTVASQVKEVIFSGIQPTGKVTLGNYLGAIQNWVELQKQNPDSEIFYCIVDQHALTDQFKTDHVVKYEDSLQNQSYDIAATLIASGIDTDRSTLFIQSAVPYHAELTWILSCIAPQNWLNQMTQYKEKQSNNSSLGLYSYPVLMASDILLYNTTLVPVGDDQVQHIELTRDYAMRYNSLFSRKEGGGFVIPNYYKSEVPRVMSLRDGTQKMSQSDQSDFSRINLSDQAEVIYEKIIKAKTDSISSDRPEVSNLLRIYSSLSSLPISEIEKQFQGQTMLKFKEKLAEMMIEKICPIGFQIEDLLSDKNKLNEILRKGNEKANQVAQDNMKRIKQEMGFLHI